MTISPTAGFTAGVELGNDRVRLVHLRKRMQHLFKPRSARAGLSADKLPQQFISS